MHGRHTAGLLYVEDCVCVCVCARARARCIYRHLILTCKSKLSCDSVNFFFAGLLYVEDRCIYRDPAEQVATTRQAQILKEKNYLRSCFI